MVKTLKKKIVNDKDFMVELFGLYLEARHCCDERKPFN